MSKVTASLVLTALLKWSEGILNKGDNAEIESTREKFSILEILCGYKQIQRLLKIGRKQARSVSAVIE